MTARQTKRRLNFAPGELDIGAAIDWIAIAAQELGATERQRFASRLCAEELLANILRHEKTTPTVAATLETDGDRLRLILEDAGAPFDPTQEPERAAPGDLDEAQPGGWGLALVRRFADECSYRHNETGNLVILAFLP